MRSAQLVPITRGSVRRMRLIGWLLLIAAPVAGILLALYGWQKYSPGSITIFEKVVIFAVIPMYALGSVILGWRLIRMASKRLRAGDFKADDE